MRSVSVILFCLLFLVPSCADTPQTPPESPATSPSAPHFSSISASAAPFTPSFRPEDRVLVDEALAMMGLGKDAPNFKKDYEDDLYRLEMVQDSLHKPLELPDRCDEVVQKFKSAAGIAACLEIQADALGKRWAYGKSAPAVAEPKLESAVDQAPLDLQNGLKRLLRGIESADKLVRKAFENLSVDEKNYLIAYFIPMHMMKEDISKEAFQVAAESSDFELVPEDKNQKVVEGRDEFYPEDIERLKLGLKVDYADLRAASIELARAVEEASAMFDHAAASSKPAPADGIVFRAETALGTVIVGGSGDNIYTEDCLAIVDLGGNDTYLNRAAGVVPGMKSMVSVVIDMAGNDRYSSQRKFSQGAGLFGVGMLADLDGTDVMEAGNFSQGAGMFGCGVLWHGGAGDDTLRADTFCQGAGAWGIGMLRGSRGDSIYYSRTFSQGIGFTFGGGSVIEEAGDDHYIAAGTISNNRPYSMSQGFGQGNRPLASGGIGILADYSGNDSYEAFYYAQGCAYWYGLGLLFDESGNDMYDAQVYAQGCGIHLSTGVLIDRGGSDSYICGPGGNAQGAAHDWAVGELIDSNGTDVYVGWGNNQGSAITNAFALFIEGEGDDTYRTTKDGGQGLGNPARDNISIGVFLDLGGLDVYSEELLNPASGVKNGAKWVRSSKGAGIDK